ncbi:MAG: hypothetical protein IJV35_06125 [Neisseriaceae bacterium]|nr:hypothetical protein [Neisseriaceae bacterium]
MKKWGSEIAFYQSFSGSLKRLLSIPFLIIMQYNGGFYFSDYFRLPETMAN